MCNLTFVLPKSPYLKDSKMGCAFFGSLKIDQVMHETGAMLKLFFTSMLRLLISVLNKDLTVWLNGLSPQTPVSRSPFG